MRPTQPESRDLTLDRIIFFTVINMVDKNNKITASLATRTESLKDFVLWTLGKSPAYLPY